MLRAVHSGCPKPVTGTPACGARELNLYIPIDPYRAALLWDDWRSKQTGYWAKAPKHPVVPDVLPDSWRHNAYRHRYSKAMDRFAHQSDLPNAEKTFNNMLKSGLEPTSRNYNVMMKGYGSKGRAEEAVKLFESLREKKQPDVYSYNALFKGLTMSGNVQKAEAYLNDIMIKKDGIMPDAATINIFVDAYAQAGFIDKARDLFYQAIHLTKQEPTHVNYLTFMKHLLAREDAMGANGLYQEMKIRKFTLPAPMQRQLRQLQRKKKEEAAAGDNVNDELEL